ncbi:DNA mismatch repair endonuclease MutL [Blattabacterium cuenoti]|uniref:DNA mismatch repair endonuclease MutL n=1 Tax=Blattabacterium cuenoti TaxID=1653831 RepID=UPI00163C4ACF|nr:DNA mismatch repair endonuclease MutL [Blattabacterium cuenoti]
MSNTIRILSKKIINQIAAGEIIVRPSSVLRELLENSIDANAKIIDIFIKDAGKTLIQLVDNGNGMNHFDARMSIKRYATSKIRSTKDLYNINTKGFRGEALSSISMISQLEIQTKSNNLLGIHLFIENGKIKRETLLDMKKGTRISVKNIFYRFPSRKIFLKSSNVEFNHIINEFYKIVLAHRDITYRFYNNNKMIFFLNKNDSLKTRIIEILKINYQKLKYFFIKKNNFIIKGFISIPNYYSSKKGYKLLLINKRSITNFFLHKNIIRSYKNFIKNIKTISYFIFIEINSNLLNWNVHPTKKEVQIEMENEKIIGLTISNKIKNILFNRFQIKKNNINNSDSITFYNKNENNIFNDEDKFINHKYDEKNIINQLELLIKDTNDKSEKLKHNYIKNIIICKNIYQKIYQIDNKYIIIIHDKNLILIDQYRAYQNILFESFFKKKIVCKEINPPIKIELSKNELILINNFKNNLKNIGFHLYFSNESLYLDFIPNKLTRNTSIKIIKNILNILKNNFINIKDNNIEKIIIKSILKLSYIKYGLKLNQNQMINLVKDLFLCKKIYETYRYNKPIVIFFNKSFFKKIFKQ